MVEYVITDGNGRYLKMNQTGSYVPVQGTILADSWETRTKAKNVLQNCINKNLRAKYSIEEIEKPAPTVIVGSDPTAADVSDDMGKLIQEITSFTKLVGAAENKKDALLQGLSQVDKEVSDIYHYIENGRFNAYKGWCAFDLLQKTLRRRRKIKNQLSVLNELFKCNVDTASIEDVVAFAKNIEGHTYTPRVLTDLFK